MAKAYREQIASLSSDSSIISMQREANGTIEQQAGSSGCLRMQKDLLFDHGHVIVVSILSRLVRLVRKDLPRHKSAPHQIHDDSAMAQHNALQRVEAHGAYALQLEEVGMDDLTRDIAQQHVQSSTRGKVEKVPSSTPSEQSK